MPLLPPPRVYNSLSRRIERIPADPLIGLYVCGITPYDAMHLGHAFTYTFFDVLVRYLRFLGHEVKYVQNITDIDDDILRKAGEVGRDWRELGDSEVAKFRDVSRRLNNLPPDVNPRATEHIEDMCRINARLQELGLAYESGGSLYFEVGRAPEFGRLFPAPYEEKLRVANQNGNRPDDPRKRDPLDFVLWQGWQEGEPWWESPWGRGRPGWHIECSAMGMAHLGESFTLHGGGRDLLFPHHDCEILQSESYSGKPFVKHWIHTGMVRLDGEKMSKSLGNMVFAGDLLDRFPADAVRLYLLARDYRSDWDYDEASLGRWVGAAEALAAELADVEAATPQGTIEAAGHGDSSLLGALDSGFDLEAAVTRLLELAASGSARNAGAAKRLATDVFGLTLGR
ncbi:MAG TPA: cysteine--tRNA ligase [Dehalococcoidia bacterium]|nr:cysteine--tRNA ligase [Dehalococcoidia bacterium]